MRNSASNWKIRTIALNNVYKSYPKDLRYRIKYEDLLKNTLQKTLSLKLKKIYPLSLCEIRFFKVIEKDK